MIETKYRMRRRSSLEILKRNSVARQIVAFKNLENADSWIVDRSRDDYLRNLHGLEASFSHIKQLPSKTVLDVGAGQTKGIHEISQDSLGQGLEFMATGLIMHPEIELHLGRERFRTTSVETLRGISDSSIGGIISVVGIEYTASPELAVRSIKRVLVAGGIVKTTIDFLRLGNFKTLFSNAGFDVATDEEFDWDRNVLLAVKRGEDSTKPARELLLEDHTTWLATL